MKLALAIVFVVAIWQLGEVTSAPSSAPSAPVSTGLTAAASTTTVKPWTQKIKDGLGKFLQGAAVASAVSQGFKNARGSKHKPSGTAALAPKPH
ncbi:hypothetical protein B5X24_HaOG204795 [Helicoverpa armigera]|uniref:Uncharacterized protein n=1 Tax=Helicoverpa armigera TaxID=29058 RepID=A0A2W1BX08_HELAM|nr:hypothetical protein B5X24_HaOG204795 [Helicoverpa armigera]